MTCDCNAFHNVVSICLFKTGYRSTLSLTSALYRIDGQHHAPAALPPGKTRYQVNWRLGGPQGRSGRVRKISPPPGFDP